MPSLRPTLVFLLLVAGVLQGCGTRIGKTLGELVVVRAEIVKKYGEEVNVHQNSFNDATVIIVTFINSSLNDKSDDLRAARAQETAELVKAHHPSISQIKSIWVNFLRQQTRFVVITYSEGLASFAFDRDAKPLPIGTNRPLLENSLTPKATYSPSQQRSEISLELRLEGLPGAGVTMFPHFVVEGDANKRPGEPLDIVTFDFASYSPTRNFPGETKVSIETDNKKIFEKEVWFSASRAADGQLAEFLYLPVPFGTFRKICTGNEVTITIGTHKYVLSRNQLFALRNMNAYVKQPYGDPTH